MAGVCDYGFDDGPDEEQDEHVVEDEHYYFGWGGPLAEISGQQHGKADIQEYDDKRDDDEKTLGKLTP